MKKRLVAVLMTCAMGMTLLAGCGSDSSKGKDDSSKSSDGKVEITFWDNYADTIHTEVYTQLIEDFEKENPDITVKYVPLPSDQAKSKYDVAIQSNSTPDCGVIYQYWICLLYTSKGRKNRRSALSGIYSCSVSSTGRSISLSRRSSQYDL